MTRTSHTIVNSPNPTNPNLIVWIRICRIRGF